MSRDLRKAKVSLLGVIACFYLFGLASSTPAYSCESQSTSRLALVIGISYGGQLTGRQDAELMAESLCKLGFSVTKLVDEPTYDRMKAAIEEFGQDIYRAGESVEDVVFYFSGHGYQIGAENYLLPVDLDINKVEPQIPLSDVYLELMLAPGANRFVFLDACRDSLGLRVEGGKTLGETLGDDAKVGLAEPHGSSPQTLTSFATQYNKKAVSGEDGNASPYTRVLADLILYPGLEIRDLLQRVELGLLGFDQVPASKGLETIDPEYYFKPPLPLPLEVKRAEDDLAIVFGGELTFSKSTMDQVIDSESDTTLGLRWEENRILLLVSNGRNYRSGQNWRVPDGWQYDLQLDWSELDIRSFECEGRSRRECLVDKEEIPFKDGPRHGRVFPVASGTIHVHPTEWHVEVEINPSVWRTSGPEFTGKQDPLWRKSIQELGLEESQELSNYVALVGVIEDLLKVFKLIDTVEIPDTSKIFGEVYGIEAFRRWVEYCMNDLWEFRLKDLAESVRSMLGNKAVKPFASFDHALNECVRDRAAAEADQRFARDEIHVWTAFGQDKDES